MDWRVSALTEPSSRDIGKLKAIGYTVYRNHAGSYNWYPVGSQEGLAAPPTEGEAWKFSKAHAQSPEGMKATMADKVRWLNVEFGKTGHIGAVVIAGPYGDGHFAASHQLSGQHEADSPEAAVDALFWKVP